MTEDLLAGYSNSEGHSDLAISRQKLHVCESKFGGKIYANHLDEFRKPYQMAGIQD